VLVDRFGRNIDYLRVSVTDRCNYRCLYCMPEEGILLEPHADILTYEEIVTVVKAAAQNGIKRVRLTGGEPLVRRDLPWLVQSLVAIQGIEEVSLTTNGSLLAPMAGALAKAGLRRVNVSLDTLVPDKFDRITRLGTFENTWAGILAAESVGLAPIKINTVAIRGFNDNELLDLAKLTFDHPWQVRFIELMPFITDVACSSGRSYQDNQYLSVKEIKKSLASLDLQPVSGIPGNGPARIYQAVGAVGTIGLISPIGEHFCNTCNRLRLTADGRLRPCLLQDGEIMVRDALRNGEEISPYLKKAVLLKPESHHLELNQSRFNRKMSQIGG
jgi:cyclic pyranopterin phosphate synthase